MEISPPRRPRRWSSACTGTLVRLFVSVVLVALVAWPERRVPVQHIPALSTQPAFVADGDNPKWDEVGPMLRRAAHEIEVEVARELGARVLERSPTAVAQDPAQRLVLAPSALAERLECERVDAAARRGIVTTYVAPQPTWRYRDASFHVLLDIIRDVIER